MLTNATSKETIRTQIRIQKKVMLCKIFFHSGDQFDKYAGIFKNCSNKQRSTYVNITDPPTPWERFKNLFHLLQHREICFGRG